MLDKLHVKHDKCLYGLGMPERMTGNFVTFKVHFFNANPLFILLLNQFLSDNSKKDNLEIKICKY